MGVRHHPLGYAYFDPCPDFDLKHLPPAAKLEIPMDGGVWVVDAETGVRYRQVTMADDMPDHVSFHTRGGGRF